MRTTVTTLGLVILLALSTAAPASAGTERYVAITSLPYTINNPGGYRLVGSLTFPSGNAAITINCDNVVLDLDGFTIVSTTSLGGTAIHAVGRNNITVRNGTLRGFGHAIMLQAYADQVPGPLGIVVEDMKVIQTKDDGISLLGVHGAIVRRCNVVDTVSQTYTTTGIRVSGSSAQVIDNVVNRTYGVQGLSTPTAIDVSDCDYAVVARNLITNPSPLNNLYTIGINASANQVTVTGNQVAHFEKGITYTVSSPAGTGLYSNNFVVDCYTPYSGGTDAGGNH